MSPDFQLEMLVTAMFEEVRGKTKLTLKHVGAANEAAFNRAVEEVAAAARSLLDPLVTTATPRSREAEAVRARARAAKRFGTS